MSALAVVQDYLRIHPGERDRLERVAAQLGVPAAALVFQVAVKLQEQVNREVEHELLYGRPGAAEPRGFLNAEEVVE